MSQDFLRCLRQAVFVNDPDIRVLEDIGEGKVSVNRPPGSGACHHRTNTDRFQGLSVVVQGRLKNWVSAIRAYTEPCRMVRARALNSSRGSGVTGAGVASG